MLSLELGRLRALAAARRPCKASARVIQLLGNVHEQQVLLLLLAERGAGSLADSKHGTPIRITCFSGFVAQSSRRFSSVTSTSVSTSARAAAAIAVKADGAGCLAQDSQAHRPVVAQSWCQEGLAGSFSRDAFLMHCIAMSFPADFHVGMHAPPTHKTELVQHNNFNSFRAWHRRSSAGLWHALLVHRPLLARRHDRYLL